MKLYPPSIEGKLPACGGDSLVIPFTMNRAVNIDEVSGMSAIIKTISTGRIVGTLSGSLSAGQSSGKYFANFNLKDLLNPLNIGQFYKIQIAYRHMLSGDIGYYSSVGVFKKTALPIVEVPQLKNNFYSGYEYTGIYSQKGRDETEKVYSYCFELLDTDGNLIDTSGIQIHDNSKDKLSSYESQDSWKSNIELPKDVPYFLIYKITTMNNLEVSSPTYITVNQDSVDIDLDMELNSKLNVENGSIELSIIPKDKVSSIVSGNFILVRASSLNNFSSWDEVYKFNYLNVTLSQDEPKVIWEDFSVQQGEEYLYALQAYNSRGLYSNRMDSQTGKVKVDFEDIFLGDSERQLKIRFNPKVTSFKNNVLESKVDTIGSKYPFIFKNGYVHYKEFQISGLISMLCDDNKTFYYQDFNKSQDIDHKRISTPSYLLPEHKLSTDLTSENIYNERQFKLAVLEWLNNGKPKIFRSATEGNYIIRIMNVSLTPNDTLGRMLHSFQCTAYEIAEWNFKNLIDLNLINLPESKISNVKIAQIKAEDMTSITNGEEFQSKYSIFEYTNNSNLIRFKVAAYNVNITEAIPGTIVGFTFSDSDGETIDIEIGGTGAYYIQTKQYPLFQVELKKGSWDGMKITFEYDDYTPTDAFSKIANFTSTDEIRRIAGSGFNNNLMKDKKYSSASVNSIIADVRREIGTIHYLRAEKRFIQEVWPAKNGKWSRNYALNDIIADNEWNPLYIYHDNKNDKYYSGKINNESEIGEPDFRLCLSDNKAEYIDLGGNYVENTSTKFGASFGRIDALRNIKDLSTLRVGSGVLIDIAYRVRTKEYVIEETDEATKNAKNAWKSAVAYFESAILNDNDPYNTVEEIEKRRQAANQAYDKFIIALTAALEKDGVIV